MTQDEKWTTLGKVRPDKKEKREFERAIRRSDIDRDALHRLRALRTMLEHEAALLAEAVAMAREQERTWDEIGEALGISKQAAWERFGSS